MPREYAGYVPQADHYILHNPVQRVGRDELTPAGDTRELEDLLDLAGARPFAGAPKSESFGEYGDQSMQFAPLTGDPQGQNGTSHNAGVLAPPTYIPAPAPQGQNGTGVSPFIPRVPASKPPLTPDQSRVTPKPAGVEPAREKPVASAPAPVYIPPAPHVVHVPPAPSHVIVVQPTPAPKPKRVQGEPSPSNVTPFKRPQPAPKPKPAGASVPPPPARPQGAPHNPHEDYEVIDKNAPRRKPRITLVGNPRGRGMGSTNEFVWYTLLYRASHGSYPVGIPRSMWGYYNDHAKAPFAKAQLRGEFSASQEFIHGNESKLKSDRKWPRLSKSKSTQSGGQRVSS